MQHSIKIIGENYEHISMLRKDEIPFDSNDFFNFAKNNNNKYSLIENGDDLLVSSWYSDKLINDYIIHKNEKHD